MELDGWTPGLEDDTTYTIKGKVLNGIVSALRAEVERLHKYGEETREAANLSRWLATEKQKKNNALTARLIEAEQVVEAWENYLVYACPDRMKALQDAHNAYRAAYPDKLEGGQG